MKKNMYEMLNESNIDINEYKKQEFTEFEKKKMKKKFNKSIHKSNIYIKSITAASIAILSVGILGISFSTQAKEQLGVIAYDISKSLGVTKDLEEYKTVVNEYISKNGLKVRLNEVILNEDELIVSTTATSNEKLKEPGNISLFGTIYINGKPMELGASGSSSQIDDYTVETVKEYDLEKTNLKGDLDVKIKFDKGHIGEKTIKGPWVFEFKTNGDDLAINTKEIKLDNTFTLENGQNIKLEKYTSNDIGQKIYFSKDKKVTDYSMILVGTDDLGNKVEFYSSTEDKNKGIFKIETINEPLSENAQELRLNLQAVKYPEKSGKMSNDYKQVGKEFVIDLNN
ncbi:MAG: DUF4179 domain-containing protein [Romboutsia sp.]